MAIHRQLRPLSRRLLLGGVLAFALAASVAVACGGDKPRQGGDVATAAPTTVVSTTAAPASSPGATPPELGLRVGDLYAGALSDLADLLRDRPEAATVMTAVRDLKESYVRQFVELGKARQDLDASDREAVDAAIRAKIAAAANEPWYAAYNSVTQHYAGKDAEFSRLVASFNIITQYANFDLLKSQEPEEAQRLGIK